MNKSLYLVAGLGKTGLSIARYLSRRNMPFALFDTRKQPQGLVEFQAEFPSVDIFLNELPCSLYPQLIAIISSPGVAIEQLSLEQINAHAIPIFGDIECLAREVDAPVIAITGTNGKSTVTTLVGEMAKAAGLSVAVAGNIGLPVLDLLDDGTHYDLWVLELSSFQLDLTHSLAPLAATILNITPDHLDRHHHFEAYCQAKQRVYHQSSFLLYNRDDRFTLPDMEGVKAGAKLCTYGLNPPDKDAWGLISDGHKHYLAYGDKRIMPVDEIRIKGQHNWANALAACALAYAAGIAFTHIIQILQNFPGLPHRSQWVRTLDGVDWINDSKGTNIGATMSAISGIGGSMQGKIVLIAGGQGKGADFSELCLPVVTFVQSVVLIGEDADKIEQALNGSVNTLRASTLDDAVSVARKLAMPGDVVLLSPACASLDMFRDFNHRGDVFTAAVCAL